MGQKPLTWQQAATLLFMVGLILAASIALDRDLPSTVHLLAIVAFWGFLIVIGLLLFSHFKRVTRNDLYPDVLARLIPRDSILQLGAVHLYLMWVRNDSKVRLVTLLQNTREGETDIRLNFEPELRRAMGRASGRGTFKREVPGLQCAIPGSAVVLGWMDIYLSDIKKAGELRVWISGSAAGSGKEVRFTRRKAVVTKKTSGCLTALALAFAGGHFIVKDGGTFLKMWIDPWPATDDGVGGWTWNLETLWTPEVQNGKEEIKAHLAALIS